MTMFPKFSCQPFLHSTLQKLLGKLLIPSSKGMHIQCTLLFFLGSDLAASVVWPEKDRLSLSGLSDCFMYILDCRSILSEEEGRF